MSQNCELGKPIEPEEVVKGKDNEWDEDLGICMNMERIDKFEVY